LNKVKLGWFNGTFISYNDVKLIFDPVSSKGLTRDVKIFISHAHSDHTYGFSLKNKKYATPETREIYEKIKGRKVMNIEDVSIGDQVKFDDVEVKLLNSGHILGSSQFKVSTPEKTILYTGDINCIDTLITTAAEPEECDELIIEATYGNPFYVFPERNKVYGDMVKWAFKKINEGKIPVFKAYAVGKSQEIVKLFNVYTNIPVACDFKVAKVNQAYLKSNILLNYKEKFKESEAKKEFPLIYVSSNPIINEEDFAKAVATGWALNLTRDAFPLSNHADFNQLINYIKQTKAKKIYLFTGQSEIKFFLQKKLRIKAEFLPNSTQKIMKLI
jgi:putative mRNA 3-end processing factor